MMMPTAQERTGRYCKAPVRALAKPVVVNRPDWPAKPKTPPNPGGIWSTPHIVSRQRNRSLIWNARSQPGAPPGAQKAKRRKPRHDEPEGAFGHEMRQSRP